MADFYGIRILMVVAGGYDGRAVGIVIMMIVDVGVDGMIVMVDNVNLCKSD